jgi:hypothetical protein
MLVWHRRTWLIDYGATLYFHHSPGWESDTGRARAAFPAIKDHVLLKHATVLEEIDGAMAGSLPGEIIDAVVTLVPDEWLTERSAVAAPVTRDAYRRFLRDRLMPPRLFVEEAVRVR